MFGSELVMLVCTQLIRKQFLQRPKGGWVIPPKISFYISLLKIWLLFAVLEKLAIFVVASVPMG